MIETTYTKSRCNECLSSLQGMLKRERASYDITPVGDSSSNDSEYAVVRRSLIDVYEEVFDMCQLQNRDTCYVAISYLDRFMAVQKRFVNIQIAAMTCFYLAVKLYEPTVIPPALLCELFQRVLDCDGSDSDDATLASDASAEVIESMEMTVLSALKWNMNPPTSMMFVRTLLSCLPDEAGLEGWKQLAHDIALSHLQVSIKAGEGTNYRCSTKGTAALFIATEQLPASQRASVYKFLLQAVHMTSAEGQMEILEAKTLLQRLLIEERQPAPIHQRDSAEDERPAKKQRACPTSSPRSVLFPISDVILS